MTSDSLALHRQRKRKFFAELAQLFDEDPPEIRPLEGAFFGPELPLIAPSLVSSSQESNSVTPTLSLPFDCISADSIESVDLNATRSLSSGFSVFQASQQSSIFNESTVDSPLLLPNEINSSFDSIIGKIQKRKDQHVHFDLKPDTKRNSTLHGRHHNCTLLPATTLANTDLMSDKLLETVHQELADYYDSDRMCELLPCWLQNSEASCAIHQDHVRRPMLLFSLQALDESIARSKWLGQHSWRVQACKLARRVLSAMWEADVLDTTSPGQDIALPDNSSQKSAVAGVAMDVWRIIARYWDKYKHNYLHQQEPFFHDAAESRPTNTGSKWDQVRALLHVYGMKLSEASSLVKQRGSDHFFVSECATIFFPLNHGLSFIEQFRDNLNYRKVDINRGLTKIAQRPTISQQDGKTAFNAILIHLSNWNEHVQVFPCGSFSRGAAYISVLDILVAVSSSHGDTTNPKANAEWFDKVAEALIAANVVVEGAMRRLSPSRGVCPIPFKNNCVLLDLKVYCPPKSWIALVYFTGPECYVLSFFASLLRRSLIELPNTSFECIFNGVAETLGEKVLSEVASEKDLFDLTGRDYLQPTDRM
ncbi:hypothetical protein CCR75_005003 [Bremia lactucae]|uniref:DNA polymerase n=1 Tax=Bremia lactucae TaxID=4779 RepID=A0A976FQ56_BRELC|nr:hypothetical protein CCR75_005003 [Bremia lactucae]